MYSHDLFVLGFPISVWNTVFLAAVAVAFFVFRATIRPEPRLTFPVLRYGVVVYLSAISAQLFANAFDATTSFWPPPDVSAWRWYFDPLAAPKTLYGVIVMMPVSVWIATLGTGLTLRRGLDLWSPAMFSLLAMVRVGCFLQGCCYGAVSDVLGLPFPQGSPAFGAQVRAGVLSPEALWSMPVIPTQAIEALLFSALAGWSWWFVGERRGEGRIFLLGVAAYSLCRFGMEFLRADMERGFYGPLATSQWIALFVLGAVALTFWSGRRQADLPLPFGFDLHGESGSTG